MRKEAKIVLGIIAIVFVGLLLSGGYLLYNHFFKSSTHELTSLEDTPMDNAKGYKLDLKDNTSNKIQTADGISVSFKKATYVNDIIDGLPDDMFYANTEYKKAVKAGKSKEELSKIAKKLKRNSGFILMRVSVKNTASKPLPFSMLRVLDSNSIALGSDVLVNTQDKISNAQKDGDKKEKDSYILDYDFYLERNYSDLFSTQDTNSENDEDNQPTNPFGDLSPVTIAKLSLIDTTTTLLPGEVREGNVLISVNRRLANKELLEMDYVNAMNMGDKSSNTLTFVTNKDNPSTETFDSIRKDIAKSNIDSVITTIKEKAVGDLLYGKKLNVEKKYFTSGNVKIQVEDALYFSKELAQSSEILKYSDILDLDAEKGIYAIKVKATTSKDNSKIGQFIINGKKATPYLIGRNDYEISPEIAKNYKLLMYRGIDTSNFGTAGLPNESSTKATILPTEQDKFLKSDTEEGYILVSGSLKGDKLSINYK